MTEQLLHTRREMRPARQPLRVLVVDSIPESRSLLRAALRSITGVGDVRESGTLESLEERLIEDPLDVLMIDDNLGEEVFRTVANLRQRPETSGMKYVLTSSGLNMESRRRGNEAGILGFLAKPFDIRSLEQALRDALGKVSTNHKDTLNKVRRIEFFSEFTDLELVRLLKICHTRKYGAGENIFLEGDRGDRLYVLIAGKVDIAKHNEDESVHVLATMVAGDAFGEMALVDASPRSADAVAQTDCMVIELNSEIIHDINDILALKLFRKMAILVTRKLREFTRARVQH